MLGNIDYPYFRFKAQPWKGGSTMDCKVVIDWKFVVAVGVVAVGVIFAAKMNPEATKDVSIRAMDTVKEYAIAKSSC